MKNKELKMLSRTGLNEIQNNVLDNLNTSTDMFFPIIDEMRELALMKAEKISLEESECNIENVIAQVCYSESAVALKKGLKLNAAVDECIKFNVIVDQAKLSRVIINLVDNAIKYSKGGEVHIEVSLISEQRNSAVFKISVTDDGIGMHPELIKNLFKPFYSMNTLETGLAKSDMLIRSMGAESIYIESFEGIGSTFFFFLKLKKSENTGNILTSKTTFR